MIRFALAASLSFLLVSAPAATTALAQHENGVPCASSDLLLPEPTAISPAELAEAWEAPDRLGSFNIVIVAGSGLSGNAPALAAFQRAADQWEAYFSDPITITIHADLVDLGSTTIVGAASPVVLSTSYAGMRSALMTDAADESDDGIMSALPASPSFFYPASFTYSGAVAATKANFKALGYTGLDDAHGTSDGTINFNSTFAFDYDNTNGVGAGLVDFETVAAHEIGHTLGFISRIDSFDVLVHGGTTSGSYGPTTLDCIRFRFDSPNNPGTFAAWGAFSRSVTYNTNDITDDLTTEYRMSTGIHNGDGRQASHWKDNSLTGILIGVMDPTGEVQSIYTVQDSDARALDLVGYDWKQCGNGAVEAGEQCDDSNVSNGDCCSSTCQYEANGAACTSDSNACTTDVCNGTGVCTHPAVANFTSCNDGLYCNGGDFCLSGICGHVGDPCAGGSQCNNICNEAADNCQSPAGTACGDGLFCNGTDTCSGGSCSVHAGDPCLAGGQCQTSCDEGVDSCMAPDGSACDDGLFCNGADTCSSGACTSHAGDPCAGGPDCADSCDESADNCAVPDGGACDDGVFCNGADTCSAGACTGHAGDPCLDGGECQAGTCNEVGDSCAEPDGVPCDDGTFCNGTDTCSGGACTIHAGDPCIGGGECADTCNEIVDTCNLPDTTPCTDDGEVCTDDLCDGAGSCGHVLDVSAGPQCELFCPPAPQEGCFAPVKHIFQLSDSADPGKDKMMWKWQKGEATTLADIGTPDASTKYRLCIYSGAAPTATLLSGIYIDNAAGWTVDEKGASYKDTEGTEDGVTGVKIKAAATGKAQVQVKRKGTLALPGPYDGTNFFDPAASIVVQLGSSDGACWGAAFDAGMMKLNTVEKVKTVDSATNCGDGVRDYLEECDGTDDEVCSLGCEGCGCIPEP